MDISCYQRSSDQELKANHNSGRTVSVKVLLLSKIVRSRIESKSQQHLRCFLFRKSCYQRSSDQELKANHNNEERGKKIVSVVIKDRPIKN